MPADVFRAAEVLRPVAHRTPVMTSRQLDSRSGYSLFFKCEQFQRVGAFKFRGAYHALSQLTPEQRQSGVVTHSSGNHAQALALAARLFEIPATVVMPRTSPAVKRNAVRDYGARIIECAPTLAARESTVADVMQQTGATLIHPYDDPRIIAGQGTAALELLQDVADLQAIVAPVGGGGLVSGTCLAVQAVSPTTQVVAAEPAGADDAYRSLASGQLIPQTNPQTIADGLLTSLGQLTWPIIREHVSAIVTVSDDEIRSAMRWLWERAKLLVEPSAATVLAAVLNDRFPLPRGTRLGLILSGGNVDLDAFRWTPAS
jgi:threonine dehydratase